ncbi:biopolymer transporter ExbD [Thioclava sp. GXIMD4216]|uniref:Biopolymer transporter ExbD n=1 Tax=Thioclava litoralis TaxID=3076557 RepID=A0ABZ1DX41_9RHOB|nr:biopolymer transporter ExbD [Thioclava sp. FTW29]
MFNFAPERVRRRPDLTPMIDVVFLLLVFFMLASRFTQDVSLPLAAASGAASEWKGAPRLVDIAEDGTLMLNGTPRDFDDLVTELDRLTEERSDPVILRAKEAELQALVTVMDRLTAAGFSHLILVE